jgi:Tol biopolymer transport system component
MSNDPGRRAGPPRDPYGLRPRQTPFGPLLALGGLALVALLTMSAITGQLPTVPTSGGGDGGGAAGGATPAPSNVVVVPKDPRADVPGTIAYAKQGSIWIQSGTTATQLTAGADDSMPAFTSDGQWIYFIRTVDDVGLWPAQGVNSYYTLTYPVLMRISPSGGKPETVVSGRYAKGKLSWFSWLREPTPNPADPNQLAVISDQPDPTKQDVVLQLLDVTSKPAFTVAEGTKEVAKLGHQDPAWYPSGTALLYVQNGRDGRRGAPSIWRYDPVRKRTSQMTGPGYLAPSFSPDGRYVAATKTSSFGTDVVVLDAKTGGEVLRVTDDGSSFSPAWSPRGDAIAFLHVVGQVVDLRQATLKTGATAPTVDEIIDLTQLSGLDATSRPSWYIPASELPTPAPSTTPSGPGSPSASPSS